jgi:hypothetical protein
MLKPPCAKTGREKVNRMMADRAKLSVRLINVRVENMIFIVLGFPT